MAEKLGWRWEFGVQLPLLFLLFLLSMVSIPRGLGVQDSKKTVREALADFDILGSTLLIVFLSLLILGLASLLFSAPVAWLEYRIANLASCTHRISAATIFLV